VIESLEPEVRDHDPMLALDGKEDGLYFYRQIIIEGKEYLKDGGYLLFEIGYDQGESVPALLEAAGYEQIQVKKDLAGLDRVVIAVYNKAEKRRR
jgi:release factor glutamine methyltransferase